MIHANWNSTRRDQDHPLPYFFYGAQFHLGWNPLRKLNSGRDAHTRCRHRAEQRNQLIQEMDNYFTTQQTILGTGLIDNSINLDSQQLFCRCWHTSSSPSTAGAPRSPQAGRALVLENLLPLPVLIELGCSIFLYSWNTPAPLLKA